MHRDHAAADMRLALWATCERRSNVSGFSGDIKGLNSLLSREKAAFLLA
jgi:hypothetical protein